MNAGLDHFLSKSFNEMKIKYLLAFYLGFCLSMVIYAQENWWQGNFGFYWTNDANWSLGHVPTSSEDVVIPGGLSEYQLPLIRDVDSVVCSSINVNSGIRISGILNVLIDFNMVSGTADFGPGAKLIVGDDIAWYSGTAVHYISTSMRAEIHVYDNWSFNLGADVKLDDIDVYMKGINPCAIVCKSTSCYFDRLYLQKENANVSFSSTSSAPLVAEYIYNGDAAYPLNNFVSSSDQDIIVNKYFTNESMFHFNSGRTIFNFGTELEFSPGDYLHHVEFNVPSSYGVFFTGDPWVKGDLVAHATGGSCYIYDLKLEGDYDNSAGAYMDMGHVIFTGSANQDCRDLECTTLELDKSGGELRFPGGHTIADHYDWTAGLYRVNGGIFEALDLVDPGIKGTVSLTSGEIRYNQDPGQYVDLLGYVFISGGLFQVNGGSGDSYWPWNEPATIVMHGGTFSFENGIYINNNNDLTENITGGVISTNEDFRIVRSDFHSAGGSVLLEGQLPGQDTVRLHCASGSYLHHLDINKPGDIQVVTTSDVVLKGDLTILDGYLKCDDQVSIAGNWSTFTFNFLSSGSTVIFNGTDKQVYNGYTTFDHLVLDNDTDTLSMPEGAYMNVNSFNWEGGTLHLDDATAYLFDLADYGIYGSYFLENEANLNIQQDGAQSLDMNAHITLLSGANLTISGGNGTSDWANFTDASLTMDAETSLYCNNNGITIHNTHAFTEDLSGGTIRVQGDFICNRTDFHPEGGVIILGGGQGLSIQMAAGSWFYDLRLLNYGSGSGGIIHYPVMATSDILIVNNLVISAGQLIPLDIEIQGDWLNEAGPDMFEEDSHEVLFSGLSNSVISGDEIFYDLVIDKTGSPFESLILSNGDSLTVLNNCNINDGKIRMSDSSMLSVRQDLTIADGAGLYAGPFHPVDFVIGGNWINFNDTLNFFQGFEGGTSTTKFDGYADQDIEQEHRAGAFHDLIIENHDFFVEFLYDTKVKGDFTMIKGTTLAPDSLWVGGDWANYNGVSGFVAGSGIVIFDGNGPGDILTNEVFNDLRIDKVYTSYDGVELVSGTKSSVLGNLHISRGTFEMNDNSELDVEGEMHIFPNAGLNAGDDTGLKIYVGGHWYDDNSAWSNKIGFNPGSAQVTFDGSGAQSVFCNATDADFYRVIIEKPSDLSTEDFVAFHTNMKVLENVIVQDGRWYDLPAGGYIHDFYNNVEIASGAKWFGGNSTIRFRKDGDQKWVPSPIVPDCHWHHVTVDKPAGAVVLYNDATTWNAGFLSVKQGLLDLNGNSFFGAGDGEVLSGGQVLVRPGGEFRLGMDPM